MLADLKMIFLQTFTVISLLCFQRCAQGWQFVEFPEQVDQKFDFAKATADQDKLVTQHLQRLTNLYTRVSASPIDLNRSSIDNAIQDFDDQTSIESKKTQLLVIGFDGFRYDYPKFFQTPNLDR